MFVYVWSLQQRPAKMAAILADFFFRFDLFDKTCHCLHLDLRKRRPFSQNLSAKMAAILADFFSVLICLIKVIEKRTLKKIEAGRAKILKKSG
jgi:hypothetical protein